MLQIIIGIITIIVGFLMVIYSQWFLGFFGPIQWMERHLHTEGGSDMGYKLIGVLFIIIGFLIMTGWIKPIFLSIIPGI